MAGIIYYLVNPLIEWMKLKKVLVWQSHFSIFIIIMASVLVWGATTLIPILENNDEYKKKLPTYWGTLVNLKL